VADPDRPVQLPIQTVRRLNAGATAVAWRRRGAGDGANVIECLLQLAVNGGCEPQRREPSWRAVAAAVSRRAGGGQPAQGFHVGDSLPELGVDAGCRG
jgi:hypothetical protein